MTPMTTKRPPIDTNMLKNYKSQFCPTNFTDVTYMPHARNTRMHDALTFGGNLHYIFFARI